MPAEPEVVEGLLADVAMMIRAVDAADSPSARAAAGRLTAINAKLDMQSLSPTDIANLAAIPKGQGDSLHRLVMDLHKSLNRLAVQCADEAIDGAHAYGVAPLRTNRSLPPSCVVPTRLSHVPM